MENRLVHSDSFVAGNDDHSGHLTYEFNLSFL